MFEIEFEWDPAKAASNARKHRVSFEDAASVFGDPLMLSLPDDEHSDMEQRLISQGQSQSGQLLVVIHTYREMDDGRTAVRIISARPAEPQERRQYEQQP